MTQGSTIFSRCASIGAIGGVGGGGVLFIAATLAGAHPTRPAGSSGAPTVVSRGDACTAMMRAVFPNATVDTAQSIAAGPYQPPGAKTAFERLPAFCRVTMTSRPRPDSSIGIELWLPVEWNGRYQQVGNHGWGGTIYRDEMAPQLRRGFVTGATDDGHGAATSPYDVTWAFNHPAKVDDLASRSVHELAQTAKLVIARFYGKRPTKSYFNGCSDGGREGLREAQTFPTDFNGILVGGAGAYWTRMANAQMYLTQNLIRTGIQGERGAAILRLAQAAATAQCSSIPDAVVGGVIMDPRRCGFDPHTLICRTGAAPADCITPDQADALAANARPLVDPATGARLFFGMPVGSEFDQLRFGYNRGPAPFGVTNYQVAYRDPSWTASRYDYRTDLPVLDRELGNMNAIDPDLSRFKAAGGKLIQYQGWGDAVALPEWAAAYYDQVVAKTGGGSLDRTQAFYRLFMLPGVGHCGAGPGPGNIGAEGQVAVRSDPQHDVVSALIAWVEQGSAPTGFVATRFAVGDDPRSGIRTQRPLCPYPQGAVWNRTGDIDKPASFRCAKRDGD